MKTFDISTDLYPVRFTLYLGEKHTDVCHITPEIPWVNMMAAVTDRIERTSGETEVRIVFDLADKDPYGAVVDSIHHEANHAAMFAVDALGIKVTPTDHEAFNYLSEYLFSKITERIGEWVEVQYPNGPEPKKAPSTEKDTKTPKK